MRPERIDHFRQNAKALGICGVLLVVLSLLPWVDRHQEIGARPVLDIDRFYPGLREFARSSVPPRVQEFIQSDDFVLGSEGTTHIRGYQVKETFPVGDGVVLAASATVLIVLGLLAARKVPQRREVAFGLALACSTLVAIGFVAVFPNWRGQGYFTGGGATVFAVNWEAAWGVTLAALALVFAAASAANMMVTAVRRD